MTDSEQYTIDVLNQLYAAERRNLLPRLMEIGVFVSWALAEELEEVRGMIAEAIEHQGWLIDAIEDAGGAVLPAGVDVRSGNLHYLGLSAVLPRVLRQIETLIGLYREALKTPARLTPKAFEVISRILHRHQEHLEKLGQIDARLREWSRGTAANT